MILSLLSLQTKGYMLNLIPCNNQRTYPCVTVLSVMPVLSSICSTYHDYPDPNYWLVMSSRLLQAWAGAGGLKTSFRWNWPPVKLVQRNQRPPKNDRSSFLNVTTYLAHGAACHSQFSSKSKLLTYKNDKASQYRNLPIIAVSMAGVTSAACSTVARTIRVHLVAWHPSSLPNQSWAQKLSLFTAELLWPPSHLADWLVPTGLRTAHSRVTHTPPPPPSLPVFCTL